MALVTALEQTHWARMWSHVNMVLNIHRNSKAYQRRGEGEGGGEKGGGGEGEEVGEREIIYLSLHCYHQNDSCIKVGSDESHFNVW